MSEVRLVVRYRIVPAEFSELPFVLGAAWARSQIFCGVLVLRTRPSDLGHLGTGLGDLSPVLLQPCGSLGHRLSGPALLPKARDAAQTGAQQGSGT